MIGFGQFLHFHYNHKKSFSSSPTFSKLTMYSTVVITWVRVVSVCVLYSFSHNNKQFLFSPSFLFFFSFLLLSKTFYEPWKGKIIAHYPCSSSHFQLNLEREERAWLIFSLQSDAPHTLDRHFTQVIVDDGDGRSFYVFEDRRRCLFNSFISLKYFYSF